MSAPLLARAAAPEAEDWAAPIAGPRWYEAAALLGIAIEVAAGLLALVAVLALAAP